MTNHSPIEHSLKQAVAALDTAHKRIAELESTVAGLGKQLEVEQADNAALKARIAELEAPKTVSQDAEIAPPIAGSATPPDLLSD